MKWMKHLLDVVTLTLISLFLILVLYEEDSEILTGSRVMLEVESWDYQHSKAEVFEKFLRSLRRLRKTQILRFLKSLSIIKNIKSIKRFMRLMRKPIIIRSRR